MNKAPKHFLDLDVMSAADLRRIIEVSKAVKAKNFPHSNARPFAGKKLAMIFEETIDANPGFFRDRYEELGW